MKITAGIFLLIMALAAAGCSLVGERPAPTVYAPALLAEAAAPTNRSVHPWQLVVTQPQTIAPLDGTRILVMPTPGEIQFYKDARWRDSAPAMLQDLLLQLFRSQGGLTAVGAPSTGMHADYVLRSELHAFQAEYDGAPIPAVSVRITFQMVRNDDGAVVASRMFDVREECATARMPDVFGAFERAVNRVLADVVAWSISAVPVAAR